MTPNGWEVLEQARKLAENGEEFALATVVWRQGPSSGQAGARAIITPEGQLFGWIGGACAQPVVVREAQRVLAAHEPQLVFVGDLEEAGISLPEGMLHIPMACQSEGALQVYIEPVVPVTHLVVVGSSPMADTLVALASSLGWDAHLHDVVAFREIDLTRRSVVVVATQGTGDEDAIEHALGGEPAFVGLVASRKRGRALLEQLAESGVPREQLGRVHTPVGLDLGHTSHREIAVSVMAELVQLRATGDLRGGPTELPVTDVEAIDPVCGMAVPADGDHFPLEVDGVTYWFCCRGCHDAFEKQGAPA